MVTSPKGGEEYVSGGRVSPHPKTKPGTIPGGRGRENASPSVRGFGVGPWVTPIAICAHTCVLGTRKGPSNGAEEGITPVVVGNVALKRAETLLQDQESDKTSLDFLVQPQLARPHQPQEKTAVP